MNRFDAQSRLRGRDRRGPRIPAHVRAIEQIAVRPKTHAVDVQLRAAIGREGAVLLVEADDPGLKQRQLDVVAPVQRQLGDRLFGDDRRQGGVLRVHQGGGADDGNGFGRRRDFQRHVERRLLRDRERDVPLDHGRKARQARARLVPPW